MHDIDLTQLEGEQFESELGGELEYGEVGLPLHETQELELASELLEVRDSQELEQFLGNVFRAAGSAAGRFAQSDTGRALAAILRDAATKALPPGGGAIASSLAQQAGEVLGLELEGLSHEDQEFEAARQFVRLAGGAYRGAAMAPRTAPPLAAARAAAIAAARRYAPGLARTLAYGGRPYYQTAPQARPYGYGGRPSSYGYAAAPSYPGPRPYRPRFSLPPYWAGGYVPVPVPAWNGGQPEPAPAFGYDEPAPYAEPGGFGEPTGAGMPDPAAAAPASTAEPPASGELGPWYGPGPARGAGSPGNRNGRWVRKGRVLIVYGA